MKKILIIILVSMTMIGQLVSAQEKDSTRHPITLKGAFSVTQNGFSFIPSFSLGKPAAIFNLGVVGKRFSFEPELRFNLEELKPWSFIFIYRYKVISTNRFQLQAGLHLPALIFSTQSVVRNNGPENILLSQRFVAAELIPTYTLTDKVNIGMFFLRGHGFDGGVNNSYFAGVRSSIKNINITPRIHVRVDPMFYYLKTDNRDGIYFTNTINLSIRNFPISISNIINKAIRSDIVAKDFDWNINLIYSFDKTYSRK